MGVKMPPRADEGLVGDRWRSNGARSTAVLSAAALWVVAWYIALSVHGGGSWHFFVTGSRVLSDLDDGSRSGLHVYAEHPLLQIGPVALGVAWALGWVSDGHGLPAAQLVGAAAGVVVVLLVRLVARRVQTVAGVAGPPTSDLVLLVAGICFAPVWLYAAVSSTHLDDILALTCGVAAVALATSHHPVWAGVTVALAVDSKPWALPFVIVLLALPSLRSRAIGVSVAALGTVLAWLPFFIAEPQTMRAVRYTIATTALSGLHVFDVAAARTPTWDRPLQTVLGMTLAGVAVWRGRATGVILLVMASRLALDPGTNRYYAAGLATGALLWDLTGSRRRWPWWSLTVVLVLHFARWFPVLDPVHAPALVAFALAAAVSVLVGGTPGAVSAKGSTWSASWLRRARGQHHARAEGHDQRHEGSRRPATADGVAQHPDADHSRDTHLDDPEDRRGRSNSPMLESGRVADHADGAETEDRPRERLVQQRGPVT